jgi:MFS family permease
MTTAVANTRLSNVYYGWWVVLASGLAMLVASAFYWQGFGVFFVPLQNEFSTNRAALSAAISLSQLEGGMLGPLGGYLVDRFGPRTMMLMGVSMMGVGFLLMSQVQSIAMFYVVFLGIISMGMSVGIRVPAMVAPANWFVRKRGLAIGIALAGSGLGGFFIPVLGWLVDDFGWRTAAVVAGVSIWCVGLPIALVMRSRPEDYGLEPDGGTTPTKAPDHEWDASSGARRAIHLDVEFTLRDALRKPVFWLLAAAFGMRQFAIGAIALHLVPFIVDSGRSLEFGSAVLAAVTVTSIAGRLGFGWLSDHFAPRHVMASSIVLVGFGALLLLALEDEPLLLVPFVLVYSVGWGGGATTMNAVRVAYFGRRAFGTISGTMDLVQMFGLVLGPVYAGFVFDSTGSYTIAFTSFAAFAAGAAVLMFFLRPPTPVDTPDGDQF